MKFFRYATLLCLAAFSVGSCNVFDPIIDPSENGYVKFEGSIEKAVSRASDETWDAADAIGIYMKPAGSDLTMATINGAENVKYVTVGGSGYCTFTCPTTGIEFPGNGSKVDFIAYYPHQTTINANEYPIDVSSQNPQKNIDLLYSNNAVNKSACDQGNVGLTFTHELAKIIVNVTAGDGVSDLNGLVVKVTGITPTATFALKDGTLTPTGTAADITMLMTGNVAEAIVVPGTTDERTFVFELNDKTFKHIVPESVTFTKRHKYTYDVTLKKDGVTVLNPEGGITDWTDSPQDPITPELENGTGPTPGTRIEFFKEVFGDGNDYPSSNRPKISAMTDWSMGSPIRYTDAYGRADIRNTATISPSVWFPATSGGNPVVSELVIRGIGQLGAFTGIRLSYDVAAYKFSSGNIRHIEVFYATTPGTYTKLPDRTETFSADNAFVSITDIDLPDAVSELKFFYDANNGGDGYRLDNVVLTGVVP